MITAREVGGDFCFAGKNRFALVMADVSGKGVPAALFMMRAKATLQGYLKGGLGIVDLAPGDGLVLYTDGVTEATDHAQALYGEDRLIKTLRGLLGARDAGTIIDGIIRNVDAFANGAEQADDITLLAFKLVSLVIP